MTWDEFKKAVEAAGVQPDDEIDYIDITPYDSDLLDVVRGEIAGKKYIRVTN